MKLILKNVSLSDIRKLAPNIPIETSSEALLEPLLFTLGIDITKSYKCLTGLLRDSQMPSKVESQVYWQGEERTDEAWRKSGFASDELVDAFRSNMNRNSGKVATNIWADM